MSRRIRNLRALRNSPALQLTEQEQKMLAFLATGQTNNLTSEDTGGSIDDYLKGPSMASILLEQAKGQFLNNQMQNIEEGDMSMAPMIATIRQLDR